MKDDQVEFKTTAIMKFSSNEEEDKGLFEQYSAIGLLLSSVTDENWANAVQDLLSSPDSKGKEFEIIIRNKN